MLLLFTILMVFGVILTPTAVYLYSKQQKQIAQAKAIGAKIERPNISEDEVHKILYNAIEREWAYRVKFHYKLKGIQIPDFEYELDYLVKEVIKSLAPGVMKDMTYYYNLDDLIKLVSHMVQILLLDFIDKNKPKTNMRRA